MAKWACPFRAVGGSGRREERRLFVIIYVLR